jgi:hypothetical protein
MYRAFVDRPPTAGDKDPTQDERNRKSKDEFLRPSLDSRR